MKGCMTAALSAFILMTSLCGCSFDKEAHLYKEIHNKYYEMKSYFAETEIVAQSSQSTDKYRAKQWYSGPNRFAFEVIEPKAFAGSGYTVDGDKIIMKSNQGKKAEASKSGFKGHNDISVADFFAEYYESGEALLEVSESDGSEVALSVTLPQKDENRYMQTLWLDEKTLLPVKLVTYDANKNPRVTVSFLKFDINISPNEENFN